MNIRKTWRRMAAILMAVMLAFSPMDGCIAGMLNAYAESVQEEEQDKAVLEMAAPNQAATAGQEETQQPSVEAALTPAPEESAEATIEATGEPSESPAAEATADVAPEATDKPSEEPAAEAAAERSALEAAIAENGYAYVRVSNAPASVYDAETLARAAEMGALTEAGSLLYAEKYVKRGEKTAAVLVRFDAADGEVKGYIRESDLEEAPVQLDDAHKTWQDASVRVWLDDARTKALPEAAFELKPEAETTPEANAIAETLLDSALKARVAVDAANLREKPDAESAQIAQIGLDAKVLLEGKIEMDGAVWYRLTYEGKAAYIRGDLVEIIADEEAAACACGAAADADGNIVHASACPMAEGELCQCYDADGARLCDADCACPCHAAENAAVLAANEEAQYLTIRVHWVGDEDKPEMRPQNNLYLYVKKDGRSTQYAASAYTNWETQTTAPLKNADGSDCVYELDYVSSYLYPAYVVTETKFENGVLDVTFQHQPTIDYDLQISWSDDNNSNGLRPEALEAGDVALSYRGGSETWTPDSIEKNEDGGWTAHFKNLPTFYRSSDGKAHLCDPSAYRYEIAINGLKPNYQTGLVYGKYKRDEGDYERQCTHLTVQCTLQTVTVKATYRMQSYLSSGLSSEVNWAPSWKYAEALGVELPDSVSMTVLSNGTPIDRADAAVTYARESGGAYPTMEKTWYLPKYDADGNEIDYGTLSVDYSPSLEKGELSGEFVQDVRKSGNLTVTISTQLYGISAVEMPATWNDEGNALAVRPTTLSATLLKDGAPYGESVTLNVDAKGAVSGYPDSWKHLLQRDADGHYIQYGIQLNDLPAYYEAAASSSPDYSAENGYGKPTTNISKLNLNTAFTLKTQTAKATVLWEGDGVGSETELKNRPKAMNLKLEYTTDGGATWQTFWGTDVFAVTMGDNSNEWTYEWSALPAVDAQGNAIEYRAVPADTSSMYVTSVDEPQYEKDVDGHVAHSAFTIHNSYNDNWNYSIDLKWNEADPVEQYKIEKVTNSPYTSYVAQYQLSISVQKAYSVGALQVRIPYELFDRRSGEGTGTVVNRFSLGPETNPSGNYSFTYRIDDKGTPDTSDDEVVFYNYKPLNASDNCVIMVEYNIQPQNIVDCSVGSLTANATGRYDGQTEDEAQQSGPITYRVDTGVELIQHSKTVVGAKYYWDTAYGAQPDDFDMTKYNYVEYKVSAYWRWNQPNTLYFVEKPGNGGEVYRVRRNSTNINFTADAETNEFIWSDSCTGANSLSREYYVLVRYPRIPHEDPMNPGQTTYETDYQNTLEFRLLGDDQHPDDKGENDKNDVVIATDETAMHWTDYEFHYDGELFSANKTMSSFRSGALTVLEYGGDAEASCYLTMTVKGYNLKNGYSKEIKDDAVYLCATINGKTTDYVRLTEEDYEFSGKTTLAVTLTGVDHTNGQQISGHVPDGSFILWGRAAGGEWEEIDRLTMTSSYANVTFGDITGKGYTQLRLTTPEDLQDEASIAMRGFNVRLKGSSPKIAQWLKEDGLSMMTMQNLAAFNVYAKDDQGQMQWANPYSQSTNSFSQQHGLDDEDKAEFGAYQYRRNYDTRLYPATESAQMIKRVDTPLDYDATQEIMTAHFSILEYETINNVSLPQEVYDAKCQNGAVIYDLLPKGFVYASDKGAQVFGANKGMDSRTSSTGVRYYEFIANRASAALVSVRTIDDYRGTGRQMVIFTVKSMLADGKNTLADYSNWYTGFGVQFYARASYDDVVSGKTLYNITAAQRDDGHVIGGGYTERGYGATAREDIFVLDENGQRALYDVNNDGAVSEETNTMYGYAEVTPSMIQTIENGLAKTVKGRSGLYQKDDIVNLSGRYSYKLRLTAQKNGETSNVVLYDILENAANTGGASGEPTGWKGTFVGVNTRVAKELGIAPVVLYSTQKLSYNDPDTLSIDNNPDAWSTTPPEDLSTVTAVAFDLRTAADGSNFIFPEDSTVEVEIIMRAPDAIQPSEYAYNRPAYNSTFKPRAAQEGYTSFNISSRTTLKLRDLQDFEFIKQFVKDDDTLGPLANVRFSLYLCTNTEEGHKHDRPGSGTGCWGTAVRTASSTTDGKVRFEDLDTGTYAIVEASVRTGFDLLRNTYWVFTVDATKGTISDPVTMGAVTSDEVQMKQENGAWTLLNQRSSIDIEINKTWKDDGAQLIRPKTLIFDLYRNGELYRTQEVEARSGSLGEVFKNLPIYDEQGNHFTYKVVERVPEGYVEENGGEADVSTSINKRQSVKFTNIRLGVLDVTKRVQGSDTTAPFGFTITLTDADGNPLKLAEGETIAARRFTESAENYTQESLTLDDQGSVHVSIAPDETLRLIGLPQGTKWQIAEDENAYTTMVTPDPASGSTGTAVNPSVVFTNIPQPAELSLNVRKAVEGNVPENGDKTFTFRMAAVTENAPMPKSNTASVTGSGTAAFDAIQFSAAGEYVYTVFEQAGSEKGYAYDATVYTATAKVIDDNGVLKAEWTIQNGTQTADEALFTNHYTPAPAKVVIPVRKSLTGSATPEDKTFTFRLTAKDNAPIPGSSTVSITGAGEARFGEITYTAAGVYTYTLKEIAGSDAGYTYDTAEKTIVVTVTDEGGALKAEWTADGAAADNVEFTNDYTPAPAKLTLPVSKTIQYVKPETDKTFSFQLTTEGDAPLPDENILAITGEGEGSFGEIVYTKAGEWHYKVQEIAGSDAGYTYDATVFEVTVTVTDMGGALKAEWTANGKAMDKLAFTNHYLPNPTDLELPVRKRLSGNARPEEKVFSFEIAAKTEDAPMPDENSVSITGEGEAHFGAIHFTEKGTWQYTVTERNDGAAGYAYDDAAYTVTVTVTDNDGNLTAEWTTDRGDMEALTFENAYHPAPVNVILPVQKRISGNETPEDKTFTFRLTARDGAPMPQSDILTIAGAGKACFGEIVYDAAGTYRYALAEIAGTDKGYTYDSDTREITVTVTDEGGALKAEWTVDGDKAESILFVNAYKPSPVSIALPVSKRIAGNETPEEKTFTFRLTARDDAPMPENGGEIASVQGEGTAEFGEISYEAAGEYAYTVEEIAGHEHGYGYDAAKHTVLVTVTDEGGALKAAWTLDGKAVERIEFVNTYAPDAATVSIPIEKRLTGAHTPQDKTFEFELTALNGAPMPENGESRAAITGAGQSAFGVIAYASAGEYRYQVREIAGSDAGYTYDAAVYDVTVTVKDENGALKASWSIPNGKQEIVFTNDYLPAPVEIDLPVRKAVEGPVPEGGGKAFEFALKALTENAPTPEQATLTIQGSGTAMFEKLRYTAAGVYEYALAETDGGETGYAYDAAVRKITVTVTDEGGALKAKWTLNGESASEILFTNVYAPEKTQIVLGAQKVLKGKALGADMFTFLLSDADGNLLQEVKNASDGSVTFAPIEYDAAGEYVYVISEKKESLAGVTYDAQTYTVRVTVTDEDGALKAEADRPLETIVFTNQYKTEIPKTGYGSGRGEAYMLAAALLMLLSGLALRKKKRT